MISEHEAYMRSMILQCPVWIINDSVKYLKTILDEETLERLQKEHSENPDGWWKDYHFSWGMLIRNELRQNVCTDDFLPSSNWDDYYIQMIELVIEVRHLS